MKKYLFILGMGIYPITVQGQQQEEKRIAEEKQQITLPTLPSQLPVSRDTPRTPPQRPDTFRPQPTPPQQLPRIIDNQPYRYPTTTWDCLDVPIRYGQLCRSQTYRGANDFPRTNTRKNLRQRIRVATPRQQQQILQARKEYRRKVEAILRNR
jgi:hypothetical protein